jgi:hypothetical protein
LNSLNCWFPASEITVGAETSVGGENGLVCVPKSLALLVSMTPMRFVLSPTASRGEFCSSF